MIFLELLSVITFIFLKTYGESRKCTKYFAIHESKDAVRDNWTCIINSLEKVLTG